MNQIRFSEFELDLELFKLTQDGEPIEIGPRSLDLLACLIQNRDRVLTPRALRKEVWSNAALSPSAIPTCIRDLRRILGDDANEPRFIETVRGRGYRFIGEIESDSHPTALSPTSLSSTYPIVGRELEQKALRTGLESVFTEARMRIIVIRGDAGIGKTRLLAEFMNSLPREIARYTAQCSSVPGAPPFWPWIQVLQAAKSKHAGRNLAFTNSFNAISAAFPAESADPKHLSAKAQFPDRFSVFNHWARAIRDLARIEPLVISFEDIQRADADSLAIISWIAEHLLAEPILLLVTHRPLAHIGTNSQSLSEIARASHSHILDLQPLKPSDIASLLDPNRYDTNRISEALAHRTNGNPYFVTHLLRHLDSASESNCFEAEIKKLPSNGVELVSTQLRDLPEETRLALEVGSIAGNRFSIPTTARLLGISNDALIARLDPAIRTSLIRDETEPPNGYRFTHALFRDALYQSIQPHKRRQLHLETATDILKNTRPPRQAVEASDHLDNAMPLASITQAREVATAAGRQALSRFAFSEAQIFLERALSLVDNDPNATTHDRCILLLELGRAQRHNGHRSESRGTILEAANIARHSGSTELLSACALQLAPDFLSIQVGTHDLTLIHLIEEALKNTEESKTSLRAHLLARLSRANHWAGTPEQNERTAEDALALARKSGDIESLIAALSAKAECLQGPARASQRLHVLRQLDEIGGSLQNTPEILTQQTRLVAALLECGNIPSLDSENDACHELARGTGVPGFLWYPESIRFMRKLMLGNLDSDSAIEDLHNEIQRLTPDANVSQGYASQQVFRQIELDASSQVLPIVSQFSRNQPRVRSWLAAQAWLQWDSGYPRQAYSTLLRFREKDLSFLSREAGGGIGMAALCEVAAAAGNRPFCLQLEELLSPAQDTAAIAGYGVVYFGSFARYLGLLALALGEPKRAIHLLECAIDHEIERGAISWQGYAEIDLAIALHQSGAVPEAIQTAIRNAERTAAAATLPRLMRRIRDARILLSGNGP